MIFILFTLFFCSSIMPWHLNNGCTVRCEDAFQHAWDHLEPITVKKDFETTKSITDNFDYSAIFAHITFTSDADRSRFHDLVHTLFAYALYEHHHALLKWCLCVDVGHRLVLILLLTQDALDHYNYRHRNLAIASLGSGELLQDYLLGIALLHEGYKNLTFNCIDIGYTPINQLTHDIQEHDALVKKQQNLLELQQALYNRRYHAHVDSYQASERLELIKDLGFEHLLDEKLTGLVNQFCLDDFIYELETMIKDLQRETTLEQMDYLRTQLYAYAFLLSLKNPSIGINLYSSVQEYIHLTKRQRLAKSSLIYMVDPGVGIGPSILYPHEANAVKIISPEHITVAMLFFPTHGAPHIYKNSRIDTESLQTITNIIQGAKQGQTYNRPTIIKNLIEAFPSRYAVTSEPFIALQDLLRMAVRSPHDAYALIHTDYKNPERPSEDLFRIKTDDFIKKDVITPYIARFLENNMLLYRYDIPHCGL